MSQKELEIVGKARRHAGVLAHAGSYVVIRAIKVLLYGPQLFNSLMADARMKKLKKLEDVMIRNASNHHSLTCVRDIEAVAHRWLEQAYHEAMAELGENLIIAPDFLRAFNFFTEFDASGQPGFWWRCEYQDYNVHWGIAPDNSETLMVSTKSTGDPDQVLAVHVFTHRHGHAMVSDLVHVAGFDVYLRFLSVMTQRDARFALDDLSHFKTVLAARREMYDKAQARKEA